MKESTDAFWVFWKFRWRVCTYVIMLVWALWERGPNWGKHLVDVIGGLLVFEGLCAAVTLIRRRLRHT